MLVEKGVYYLITVQIYMTSDVCFLPRVSSWGKRNIIIIRTNKNKKSLTSLGNLNNEKSYKNKSMRL